MDELVFAKHPLLRTLVHYACNVYRALGYGLSEVVYHRALEVELRTHHHDYDSERIVDHFYGGSFVGSSRLDLLVDRQVVLELKAIAGSLKDADERQAARYAEHVDVPLAVLINFPQKQAESHRLSVVVLVRADEWQRLRKPAPGADPKQVAEAKSDTPVSPAESTDKPECGWIALHLHVPVRMDQKLLIQPYADDTAVKRKKRKTEDG